ncbi:MAG: cobaltochelatase subunit CobN [Rikenellaceae bacterium]
MRIKKNYIFSIFAVVALAITALLYNMYISPTRIATINYPDFMVEKLVRSNDNSFVKIDAVTLDKIEKINSYDIVLVRIHGLSMGQREKDALTAAIGKGVTIIASDAEDEKINSLYGRELEYISTLLENGSVKNYRSMFNYLRKNVDRKKFFNSSYDEPLYVPNDYFFHLGEDEFFATFEEYDAHYRQKGLYKDGAPRVALLMGNINLQNSNEEHIAALITTLESKGLNVYPISSFGEAKLGMIEAVKPNVIINNPHGRLVMGNAKGGEELLKKLNVPILSPITISQSYDSWMEDKQGMAGGGMTSMSVVLPELDGAIMPFAISAQFERDGRMIFDSIPGRNNRFCNYVNNFAKLQTKDNAEKKVAIYYYKGVGKGTINAESIEGVESLYNTLKGLKSAGYNVDGLPSNVKQFEAMVQTQGSVLGAYALGAYDEFLKNGNPALVSTTQFEQWSDGWISDKLKSDMKRQYGDAPGEYMSVEKDGESFIAVARIEFGNVAILPQPLPSVGEDVNKIIHGVAGAPTYPYVASYMWTRNAFKADAMIHFGTHGSLEFIPGKQMALSSDDWSDLLLGDMPHFYIYTVNNIGEGIIAKRRGYATLVSHLTSPFMEGDLYDEFSDIDEALSKVTHLEDGALKQRYIKDIEAWAKELNIYSSLGIDPSEPLNDESLEKIHCYIEEIEHSKVRDGLYTLGEAYTEENLLNTARLMSVDPIKYALANLDVAHGVIDDSKLDNVAYLSSRYNTRVDRIISRVFRGEDPTKIFNSLVKAEDLELYNAKIGADKARTQRMMSMMSAAMAKSEAEKPKFLDAEGHVILNDSQTITDEEIEAIIEQLKQSESGAMIQAALAMHGKGMIRKIAEKHGKDKVVEIISKGRPQGGQHPGGEETKKAPSMMDRMASANSMAEKSEQTNSEVIITAVGDLKIAIESITSTKENLKNSTRYELESLLDALSGGYIEPSTAGDPIVNPKSVPTGRNFYGINPETTPTKQAWSVGKALAENLLAAEMEAKGKYPEKVSFTLWSSSFITSEGSTVAQILYLLGVEPMRDGFGYIRSLRLIPSSELKRPRIDVVVQTSGQLRDIAASRLELINRAIEMAANDTEGGAENFVSKGLHDAEKLLLERGFSPVDARKYAKQRVFGVVNGNYGAGIMGLVESGDKWEDRSQIAEQYINNMGAIYGANGDAELWGDMREGVFEAALLNTSVVVQPRSSNMWGALSLDHVYEFMGGLSVAVEHVTGEDPTAYFNDYRNSSRAKVQPLKEAIGVETASTLFNPKYIREMTKGSASAMSSFAEAFNNTYGWNSMKPSAIDDHIWNEYYEVYVKDKHNLDLKKSFEQKNPYALQDMTAIMLETARKGMWEATDAQLKDIAELHTEMVQKHSAACSGFVCNNAKLREFISQKVSPQSAELYNEKINEAREVKLDEQQSEKSVVLKKEEQQNAENQQAKREESSNNSTIIFVVIGVLLLLFGWLVIKRRGAN